MIDNRTKIFVYSGITLVVIGIFLLLSIGIITPMIKQREIEKALQQQKIEEEKQKAEQIKKQADSIVDEVFEKLHDDSVQYVQEQQKIQRIYIKQKKSLDAIFSNIDTISDGGSFGTFSVRGMLSDSASKLP